MLAVFHKEVAEGPAELHAQGPMVAADGAHGRDLITAFRQGNPQAVIVSFDSENAVAYTLERQNLLKPRSFGSVDNIFTIFEGTLDNLAQLRLQYGLGKSVTDQMLCLEVYRVLRDRAPYPADQAVGHLKGGFAFITFDNSSKTIFVASDSEGRVPLWWGTTSDGSLAFADDPELLSGCGKSMAPFPPGCFFTSMGGLRSHENPTNVMKPVTRVDSAGDIRPSMFKVDSQQSIKPSLPKVGSDVDMYFPYGQ
ncbi:hypothetical protein CBR_g12931 [Chara braunii]|uniref:DUF3700 domain-containing protein n=1 Tax=Chara braunii TaxID=69332 RepID=A0A388KT23_CHABU|nr:hypothetical protein CBR_g12931 [Chara braunii]|eukprot:GBG73214.1 hypothetical protein CBR_g12931 [Chara braunii]